MKKWRNQLILSLLNKKQILIMMKMLLNLYDQMKKKKTRKILFWLTSTEACKSKQMRKLFQKCNSMISVLYLMKRKIKNIFLEVISNTKIFSINFFNENANDQDFAKLTGDWTTPNTVFLIESLEIYCLLMSFDCVVILLENLFDEIVPHS